MKPLALSIVLLLAGCAAQEPKPMLCSMQYVQRVASDVAVVYLECTEVK